MYDYESYLTIPEVARRLGISGETVRRIIKRGELKAVKLSRWAKVDPCELRDYIDQKVSDSIVAGQLKDNE